MSVDFWLSIRIWKRHQKLIGNSKCLVGQIALQSDRLPLISMQMFSLESFSSPFPTQCKRLTTSVLAAEQGNRTEVLSGYYWNCHLIILLSVYLLPILRLLSRNWELLWFLSLENRHCICLLRWWEHLDPKGQGVGKNIQPVFYPHFCTLMSLIPSPANSQCSQGFEL